MGLYEDDGKWDENDGTEKIKTMKIEKMNMEELKVVNWVWGKERVNVNNSISSSFTTLNSLATH